MRWHVVNPDGTTVMEVAGRATTAINSVQDFVTMADLDGDDQIAGTVKRSTSPSIRSV